MLPTSSATIRGTHTVSTIRGTGGHTEAIIHGDILHGVTAGMTHGTIPDGLDGTIRGITADGTAGMTHGIMADGTDIMDITVTTTHGTIITTTADGMTHTTIIMKAPPRRMSITDHAPVQDSGRRLPDGYSKAAHRSGQVLPSLQVPQAQGLHLHTA